MESPILFYDGECGFCQKSVQLILKNEKEATFLFAPLQGETASTHLPASLTKKLDSIVILYDGNIYTATDALLLIVSTMKFPYSLAKVGKVVPKALRDAMYAVVARNRQTLSKIGKTCRVPTIEERARFLK